MGWIARNIYKWEPGMPSPHWFKTCIITIGLCMIGVGILAAVLFLIGFVNRLLGSSL